MSDRNEYKLSLVINERHLSRVVIDQHYQVNHPEINDELILELVKTLDLKNFTIDEKKTVLSILLLSQLFMKISLID